MPAWWAVATPNPAGGTPGVTDATFTGGLTPNPDYQPDAAGLITVWADTATQAATEALRGMISATIAGETVDYYFTPDHAGAAADHLPFAVSMSGTTATLTLEDQAYFPGIEPDWDYDDRLFTGVTVTPTAAPVVHTNGWTYTNASGNGSASVQLKVTRPDPDTYHWNYALTNNSIAQLFPSPGLNQFEVIARDASLVENLGSTFDTWTRAVNGKSIYWRTPCAADGPYLGISKSAEFWFDTPPVPIAAGTAQVAAAGAPGGGGTTGGGPAGGTSKTCAALESHEAIGATDAPAEKPRVYITDGNMADIGPAGLKVAKWENAFELDAAGKAVVKSIGGVTGQDFIDGDTDRFNVWVYDPVKWDEQANQPVGQHRTTVKISTTNVVGFEAYNDDPTEVDLIRCPEGVGKGKGWYWSDSQMLVSNQVDDADDLRVNGVGSDDQGPGAFGPEKHGLRWKVSDRTHRVALRGTVKADYPLAVPDEDVVRLKHTVNVNVNIMSNAATGSAGVVTVHEANGDIVRANEQFAQAGILLIPRFQDNLAWPLDTATGKPLDLTDGLDDYPAQLGADGKNQITNEERALLGSYRTPDASYIDIYYVNKLASLARGEAFSVSYAPEPAYQDAIIISKTRTHFTVAHEIMHVLNDALHYNGVWKEVNLLRGPTDSTDKVTAGKRIRSQQDSEMNGDPGATPAVPPKRPNLMK